MSELAISLTGVTKRYGARQALSGLDLQVPRGSIYALLGPNGSGKTTTLRLLLGLIHADGGSGEVLGQAFGPGFPSVALRERIGYVAERNPLYERSDASQLIALCRGLNSRWNDAVVKRYLDLFQLPTNVSVRHMSTGMRAQLALTLAMGGEPELLILDEPTHGLDPLRRHEYLQALLADSMGAGRTVLMSSHDLHQIERLADHVAILRDGKIVVASALDDLKETEKRVRVGGRPAAEALRAMPGVRRVGREGEGFLLHASGSPEALVARLNQVAGVTGVQVLEQSLEEIFLSYVGESR